MKHIMHPLVVFIGMAAGIVLIGGTCDILSDLALQSVWVNSPWTNSMPRLINEEWPWVFTGILSVGLFGGGLIGAFLLFKRSSYAGHIDTKVVRTLKSLDRMSDEEYESLDEELVRSCESFYKFRRYRDE